MPGALVTGVTHLPAETGPYLWLEPSPARMIGELAEIRAAGIGVVRLPLAWDAFMPSDRQVSRPRLRELGELLAAAAELSLGVVPVLFAQSFGDCILLPGYAVDRRRARPGVRVVVEGEVRAGGPRDVFADPLMLEAQELWLRTMLDAFANHPAIAAWDLGGDPASTARPQRIAHVAAWAELFGGMVRARQDACWCTLGAGDVLGARGMRLAAVAPHVDALGLLMRPLELGVGGLDDPAVAVFVTQLAQRLASAEGAEVPVHVHLGLPAADPAPAAEAPQPPPPAVEPLGLERAAAHLDRAQRGLIEAGAGGLLPTAWCDAGPRQRDAPPCDRRPWLGVEGLADRAGALKPHGAGFASLARSEPAAAPAAPWPERLDVAAYYANLPDSARDLLDRWRRDSGEATGGG